MCENKLVNPDYIETKHILLKQLLELIQKPDFVSMEFPDTLILEWVEPPKRLLLFVDAEIEYIRSWGINIHTNMDDGCVKSLEDFKPLVNWLNG